MDIIDAWRTNNVVTIRLIERLPEDFWRVSVPASRRTIRAIAAHLHNARCSWIRTLGSEHGIAVPPRVAHDRATPRQVVAALKKSGSAMEKLLQLGIENGGTLPDSKRYVWRNLALDVPHVLTYFIAHDAHHRGQIVMIARATGHRLERKTVDDLWQWK